MRRNILFGAAGALIILAASVAANASVITVTLPEFNGTSVVGPQTVGTFNYVIPSGAHITAVSWSSTFGNSSVASTAIQTDYVAGIAVASCPNSSSPCWNSSAPMPISFNFSSADFSLFSSGSVNEVADQTGCCTVRLGPAALTITTENSVPEPPSIALFGLGLFGLGIVSIQRQRRRA